MPTSGNPTTTPFSIEQLLHACHTVLDAHTGKPLLHTNNVRVLNTSSNSTHIEVALPYAAECMYDSWRTQIQHAWNTHHTQPLEVQCIARIKPHAVRLGVPLISGVKNIIAVSSAKGGVGKSTTAVNIALALVAQGARVGLLDADIYGPSIPALLDIKQKPEVGANKLIQPITRYGLHALSMGLLVDAQQAVVWRAPMAVRALTQLMQQTNWALDDAKLDYLIVDMPPGTGDIQLSMAQNMPLTAAVVITTPQDLALLDVQKGMAMFNKLDVPVLGVVENMALHVCSQCGHSEAIFGTGGGAELAQRNNTTLLGSLPLNISIRTQSDAGKPNVVAQPDSAIAQCYTDIALKMAAKLSLLPINHSHKIPPIQVA